MKRALQSAARVLLGRQRLLSAVVIAAAVGTAALQSAGFAGWWALPLLVIALLAVGARRPQSRSRSRRGGDL
jgi:hypothetical protein